MDKFFHNKHVINHMVFSNAVIRTYEVKVLMRFCPRCPQTKNRQHLPSIQVFFKYFVKCSTHL